MEMNKICVIGLGYIGLPTATMFAANNKKVIGVDVQDNVVKTINKGRIHIEEPGLAEMVKIAVLEGNLRASIKPERADAYIIAVPTPLAENKGADLSYVEKATESILPYLDEGNLVIVESTVSPRTTEDVVVPILARSGLEVGEDLYVAHCPERVLPGKIIYELVNNNRVIGGINEKSALKARVLYSSFVKGEMYITDATTAEMVKLMENTFRDVNIALANELAKVAKKVKVDIWEAIELANKHPRVNLHRPGPGVGGHCIAIDPWFIVESAPEVAELIHLSRNINDSMPEFVVDSVKQKLSKVNNPQIAIFGITYKGNVDDLRESPVLKIIELLKEEAFDVRIYDPHVNNSDFQLKSIDEAVKNADCIIIGTDHNEFRKINPSSVGMLMKNKILFDTKNLLDLDLWENAGFETYKLGDYSDYDWQKEYGIKEFLQAEKEVAVLKS